MRHRTAATEIATLNAWKWTAAGAIAAILLCSAAVRAQAPSGATAPAEPAELAPLRALMDDEGKALEALRDFDIAQQRLSAWDMELAEDLARNGDEQLAEDKARQASDRMTRVREAYELFLGRYPRNPYAMNYYGEIMFDYFNDEAAALSKWQAAAAMQEDFGAPRNNLALYYSHTGNYQLAFQYMDEALKLEKDNPDYLFNAAQMYLIHFPQVAEAKGWSKEKVYDEAMDMSRRAAEALPDDYQLAADYAVNFFAAPNFDLVPDWRKAAQAWVKARTAAIETDDVFYTWLNEARAWVEAEEWEKAETAVNEALKIHPDSGPAQVVLQKAKERQAADR